MPPFRDITNQIFTRLTAIRASHKRPSGAYIWECVCSCDGKHVFVGSASLIEGNTRSCGCLSKEASSIQGKRNATHGWSKSREYAAYNQARMRCRNPQTRNYADYGGRGIEFRFTNFEEFLSHIGPRPSPEYSLDRIDNEKHYEHGNVRWATLEQQHRNRRPMGQSKYRGVWTLLDGRFQVGVWANHKLNHVGFFLDAEKAAKSYDEAALELLGDEAVLNFPEVLGRKPAQSTTGSSFPGQIEIENRPVEIKAV